MNSVLLTEKQQEVLWLRYGREASIDQIARWLKISRRAVLSRLRNARRRTCKAGLVFPEGELSPPQQKARRYTISQITAKSTAGGSPIDDL